MAKKTILYFCLIAMIVCGCNQFTPNKKIKFKGIYSIPINPKTALSGINKLMVKTIGDSTYLSFYDEPNNTFYIYSFLNRTIISEINIQDSLFNSYGSTFYFHNLDSIFLLDLFNTNLHLIDNKGSNIWKINLRSKELIESEFKQGNLFVPYPHDELNSSGFIFMDNKIFISSGGSESVDFSKNCKDIFAVDLKNKKPTLVFNKPEIYYNGCWGHNLLHGFQLALNTFSNEIIVSYGADPYVYVTNFRGHSEKHLLKSKYLKKMSPFGYRKPSQYKHDDKIDKYDYTTGSYSRIYYDERNKRIYRFVNIPLSSKEFDQQMIIGKLNFKHSIIVSDDNYNKIDEILLDPELSFPVFISNGDLYFFDKDSYQKNQDSIYFKIYSIKL